MTRGVGKAADCPVGRRAVTTRPHGGVRLAHFEGLRRDPFSTGAGVAKGRQGDAQVAGRGT